MDESYVFAEERWGSFSAEVPQISRFYIWGGYAKDHVEGLARRVDVYSAGLLHHQLHTIGSGPSGLYGGSATYSQPHLYAYGGEDDSNYFGTLHRLELKSKQWSVAAPFDQNGPMKKSACGMVSFGNKLVLFGGFGLRNSSLQPGSTWVKARGYSSGWTNEIHSFSIEEETWYSLDLQGERPPPCGSFSFTMIDDHRAVLFGGKQPTKMSNDIFLFDFNKVTCEKIDIKGLCPRRRAGHSAVCLGYKGRCPQLLVTGGLGDDWSVLDDVWILDINARKWEKCLNFGQGNARFYHCSAALCHENVAGILLIGGCSRYDRSFQTNGDFPPAQKIVYFKLEKEASATDAVVWKLIVRPTSISHMNSSEIELNDNELESMADSTVEGADTDINETNERPHSGGKLDKTVKNELDDNKVDSEARVPAYNPGSLRDSPKAQAATDSHDEDSNAKFENFSENITEALFNNEKLTRNIANINIVGLPEGGKTCLLCRLIKKSVKEHMPSTGVCDATIMVDVAPASTFLEACPVNKEEWVLVDHEESFVKQITECKQNQSSRRDLNSMEGPLKKTEEGSPSGADISAAVPAKSGSTVHGYSLGYQMEIQENVKSVLQKHNLKSLWELKNSCSIYLRDTGGQLEFQESLSLVINGPSMVLFVFNASIDINTPQPIKYRMKGEIVAEYRSNISTKDALLQCLASVFATHVSRSVGAVVYIIGTHVDKLLNPDEEIECINEKIKEIVKTNGFSDLVRYFNISKGRLIFTVNNFSDSDEHFKKIRHHISEVLLTEDFVVEYPVSYLLFSLDMIGISKSIIKFDDCEKMAAQYNIASDAVRDLLRFLNDKTGILQWYNVPGLKDFIIKEPQVFYNKITELIISTFSSSYLNYIKCSEVQAMQSRGIFEASLFNRLVKGDDEFPSQQFVLFLIHLRMAAKYKDECGKEKYFIPCILKRAREPPADSDGELSVRLLCFTFKCGHCPKGLFGALITHLMMPNQQKWNLEFKLKENAIFRDQVSFFVHSGEERDEITLKLHSSRLKVVFIPQESGDRVSPNNVCIKIRETLESLVEESLTNLKYDPEKVGVTACLSCSKCGSHVIHPVKTRKDRTGYMHCNRKKLSEVGPWFLERNASSSDAVENTVNSSRLGINDLPEVQEEIWEARAKWYNIGIALKLPVGTLKAIETNSSSVDNKYTEMLQNWLQSGNTNRTWGHLAEVMKRKTVALPDLSQAITTKYCQ